MKKDCSPAAGKAGGTTGGRGALLLAALLAGGCATAGLPGEAPVTASVVIQEPIGGSGTYGFVPVTDTLDPLSFDWIGLIGLKAALADALGARGYMRAEGNPSLLVALYAAGEGTVAPSPWGRDHGWEDEAWETYLTGLRKSASGLPDGTFLLDIVDSATWEPVYRALSAARLPVETTEGEGRARIGEIASRLLDGVPHRQE